MIRRIVRGFREHGIKLTAIHALDFVGHYWFDMRYGTDTAAVLRLEKLNVVGENKKFGGPYMPTRSRPFRKLMDAQDFPPGSVFVDLGCGKGKVVLMATEYEFKRIVGVEFSPELVSIAKQNVARFWAKKRLKIGYEVILGDVAKYAIKEDENIFFLYNSFGRPILESFLKNLDASLRAKPREAFLIYNNPVCRALVDEQPLFSSCREYVIDDYQFVVYRTDATPTRSLQSASSRSTATSVA
jgi:SAM-dependent methyltransferase